MTNQNQRNITQNICIKMDEKQWTFKIMPNLLNIFKMQSENLEK
jgi:hypothetical protein